MFDKIRITRILNTKLPNNRQFGRSKSYKSDCPLLASVLYTPDTHIAIILIIMEERLLLPISTNYNMQISDSDST